MTTIIITQFQDMICIISTYYDPKFFCQKNCMTGPIFLYCFITFFITWGIILPSYFFFKSGILTVQQLNFIYILGALGPFIASYLCCWLYYGKSGIKRLNKSLKWKRVGIKTWLFALFPILLTILALITYPIIMGRWFSFSQTKQQFHLTNVTSYIYWILPFIAYAIFEEFGWRGFLLPHLQNKFNAFKSTLILGGIWALWHAPFFLWRFQFNIFVGLGFLISIMMGAFILTSLYNQSRGSIVPVILFHLSNNSAASLDREYLPVVVSIGLIFLAIYLFRKYGKATLCTGACINFLSVKPSLFLVNLKLKKKKRKGTILQKQ